MSIRNHFQQPILIVDDDPLSCELLIELLTSEGYVNLRSATDGETALKQVAASPPDLILLDIMLPGINGFEICRRLKSDPNTATIPIVLVTALVSRDSRLEGLEAGADDFLTKPIDEAELLARTRSLLRTRRLYQDWAAAVQAQVEFISQVSHELRTPLFAISGLTEMLLNREVTQPEEIHRNLQTIYGQIQHLTHVVDALLELSRLSNGGMHLSMHPLCLQSFLEDSVALMQPQAKKMDIRLNLESVSPELVVRADEARLRQALLDLIKNALFYNDPGGWVQISANQQGDRVVITVCDNGWGIPAEDLPRIFERFYRGQQLGAGPSSQGSGLGLALAQEIVHAHNGKITVESAGVPGKGSCFRIELPLEDAT